MASALRMRTAMAAMDSCFRLVGPHQHGITRHYRTLEFFSRVPFTAEADSKHPFKRQLHTIHAVAEQSRLRFGGTQLKPTDVFFFFFEKLFPTLEPCPRLAR